jgi:succinoglycan biosynthesis transport protein ExoP
MVAMQKPAGKKDLDLFEYWQIVKKRKWVIVSTTAVLVALTLIISFTTTPLYQATTSIQIDEPGSSVLTIQDLLSSNAYSPDILGTYFKTQLKILQSRSLVERVAKKMNLAGRPELQSLHNKRPNLLQMVKWFVTLSWLAPRKSAAASVAPGADIGDPYAFYAKIVLDGLSVQPVAETRLVDVKYEAPSPRLAADIVNTLAQEFINFTIESRFEATKQTSEFLNEQIAKLRDDLALKEKTLQRFGEDKKLLVTNDKENSVLSKFSDLDKAYTEAQIARVAAEAQYRELKSLSVDSLPQFINNPLIQSLKTSYLQIKSEYEQKSRLYKPEYVDMIQLKTRLDSLKNQLETEIQKAVDAAESTFRTAQSTEASLFKMREAQRADVNKMNSDAIFYKSLEIERQNMQALLNSLVAKQNETGVSARLSGLNTSNIKIVDKALVPEKPVSPNTQRNLIIALLLGLMGGLGLAFLADVLDNTVKGPDDLQKLMGLPSFGIIPHFSPGQRNRKDGYYKSYGAADPTGREGQLLANVRDVELINYLFPKLPIAEDYRTIRTSILFSQTVVGPKTIALTSASPQEGKSATLTNMAVSFAQLGEKVLAIDADLRKPRLHKIFKIKDSIGLSGYLTGRLPLVDVIQKTFADNLWLLPSGPHPPNPAELLNSKRMQDLMTIVKDSFDVILIDTPPVLAVIDPLIISSFSDLTILVIKTNSTKRKLLLKAIEELKKAKAEVVGAVFNDAKIRSDGYYAPYFQYEYYQDKASDEASTRTEKRNTR